MTYDVLVTKPPLNLCSEMQSIYDRVEPRIAAHDHMNSNMAHYFSVGASAVSIVNTCRLLGGVETPSSLLDFACGAGRITRWLKAAYPSARITGADLRDSDLQFQRDVMGVDTWKSSASFAQLEPRTKFDIIWVGSLLSHLSEESAAAAMNAFLSWLNPSGILIVSFHGRRVRLGTSMRGAVYTSLDSFKRVETEYLEKGFGYEDYHNQVGLGFALTKPQWFFDLIGDRVQYKMLGLFEGAWDNHHDICAIQNTPVCVPM
jgi:SAM-dependent methyltransferase